MAAIRLRCRTYGRASNDPAKARRGVVCGSSSADSATAWVAPPEGGDSATARRAETPGGGATLQAAGLRTCTVCPLRAALEGEEVSGWGVDLFSEVQEEGERETPIEAAGNGTEGSGAAGRGSSLTKGVLPGPITGVDVGCGLVWGLYGWAGRS